MNLNDVLHIKTGYSIRGRIQPVTKAEGDLRLLQMKDIDPVNGINSSNLSYIKLQGKKAPEYLSKGDIVFIGRGVRFFAVCLTQDLPETTAAPQLLVLKVKKDRKDHVLPEYVAWYLNHRRAQSYFHKEAAGTAVTLVSKSSLEKMPIELPPIDKQKLIVKINDLSMKEKQISEKLEYKKEQLVEQLLDDIL